MDSTAIPGHVVVALRVTSLLIGARVANSEAAPVWEDCSEMNLELPCRDDQNEYPSILIVSNVVDFYI